MAVLSKPLATLVAAELPLLLRVVGRRRRGRHRQLHRKRRGEKRKRKEKRRKEKRRKKREKKSSAASASEAHYMQHQASREPNSAKHSQ
jgi:hypothetical protein